MKLLKLDELVAPPFTIAPVTPIYELAARLLDYVD